MGGRAAKAGLFDALSSVAKALGNGRRAEIVDVLCQGERSVEEIAGEIDQTLANTSQHLQHLLRAGLVRTRREGNRVHYALSDPRVAELWALIRDVSAAQIADVERLAADYLGDRGNLVTVSRTELARRLADGDVIVIDVRPPAEFQAGHIAGALSMPIDQLVSRLSSVPDDRDIVAYCRGPYCVYADDAVRTLRRLGRRSARLEDGYPEWVRAGLPISTEV